MMVYITSNVQDIIEVYSLNMKNMDKITSYVNDLILICCRTLLIAVVTKVGIV